MSNTIRIRTTPNGGDKYLKLPIKQDWDFIEILSLKISQEDAYRKFCSDYGVIVGRVYVNSGFGAPNCKVSVFIPLDSIDAQDPLISGLYPFEIVTDKDNNGVRYNLLPSDNETQNSCYTPIGTFPTKREVLDNETMLGIYCKYYKFTTTTNHAGDFMIFGVPLGAYTVHVDADISDIGIASQRPYDLINQGIPAHSFQSPTKFNDGNLDKLQQIKTLNVGVNVQPFWGDTENCQIGITRLDLDLNHNIIPSAIFMGSIFGDQHKHSVNKNCHPRNKVGSICEQMTGPGSINMIRKTIDGQIENFDVQGGRVIDDDGAWAYQIPMNLDYMITDETGNLIFSQDPNKGIPTRASVRFNIGLDENGGEGRVRTRARYLVPNNPKTTNEIDYEFGTNTKDTSFRDMYWNKIYSISNFISRFQRVDSNINTYKTRNFVGIKEVDDCAGDKTPFPYNRIKGDSNPLFFIVCIILEFVIKIVALMNLTIIPLMNNMIALVNIFINGVCSAINDIISFLNSVSNLLGGNSISQLSCNTISYMACIILECPTGSGTYYAPGCLKSGGIDAINGNHGWSTASPNPTYFPGDGTHPNTLAGDFGAVGLDQCMAIQAADSLDLYQIDFYNDWVNGTLYAFLLKYKKTKTDEKYCDYDITNNSNILVDTCVSQSTSPNNDAQYVGYQSRTISEGLIKKVGDEFFYGATTNLVDFKMYATEVISLGSVFDCDWQGISKIQQYLLPTTYKIPPQTQELVQNNTTLIETTGMVSNGTNSQYLFFKINCLGIHVDDKSCLNARHICEFGVEIDEANPLYLNSPDGIIGSNDIDNYRGTWVREVFLGLNETSSFLLPTNGTNFNTSNPNLGVYDFNSPAQNNQGYLTFRNYQPPNVSTSYGQPDNSYFFYFGLLPGKTAVDKMNQRFFTTCGPTLKNKLTIQASSTVSITHFHQPPTGTITFSFIGGTGPYSYSVSGVVPLSFNTVNGITIASTTINHLFAGTYIITGVDMLGAQVTKTVIVPVLTPLYSNVIVTKNASTFISSDGQISITSVGGGVAPYTYELTDFSGNVLIPAGTPLSAPLAIPFGLSVDITNGYVVNITDSNLDTISISGLKISGLISLQIQLINSNGTSCYNSGDGTISLSVIGGQPPYTITTTGPNGFYNLSLTMTNLVNGTYVTTVVDSLGATTSLTTILTAQNQQMVIQSAPPPISYQPNPFVYEIPFYITAGVANNTTANVEYDLDNTGWTNEPLIFVNSTTAMFLTTTRTFSNDVKIRFKNANGSCYSNIITISKSAL